MANLVDRKLVEAPSSCPPSNFIAVRPKPKVLYPISSGKIKGRRIIDVGSGPTIHMMIPAAKWFDEIYISDFSIKNVDAQKKWLARSPDSYDWKPFFQYFAEKDGKKYVFFLYPSDLSLNGNSLLLFV